MLNPHRLKALEGLLDYLSGMQGGDLKSLMNQAGEGSPLEEANESPLEAALEKDPSMDSMDDSAVKPKGIAIEKVSVLGKPGMDKGMSEGDMDQKDVASNPMDKSGAPSDDELEELFNKFRK